MINFDDQTAKPGQTSFYSELNLSIENKLNLKLPLETLSCEEEYSKFRMISNFLQEQQRKEGNSLHSLDSSSRESNTDQDLSSPNLKKTNQNGNTSHFSNQNQSNNSPTKSIAPSNFDDSSENMNSSVFQDFQLQNFIRKRNSEILKNLSRGSLCASDSTQKENTSEASPPKPKNLLKVLNFDDQYALKRVSLNFGAPSNKHITPLILLHKRNLMKKVLDNPTKYIASSDSENEVTDEENSFLKEDEEKIAIDDRKERTYFFKISVLQTEKLNFNEIVKDNLKKYPRNTQEALHNANIGDISDELDVNEMIKKRMLSRNIEILDRNERIYRKGTYKQIKMIPFYLFDFENSQMISTKIVREKYIISKAEEKIAKFQQEIPDFSGFLETIPEESKDKTNSLQLSMGNIGYNEPKKENRHHIFIKNQMNNNNILFQFLSFQGKFLHSHRIESSFKSSEKTFFFKENISVQMKQCSKEFLENLSKNFEKNQIYGQNVKENLIKTLSTPKIFVKDIGSKAGTFVKLKTNNPLALCEGNLIMISGHLGFFVEELLQIQDVMSEDPGYSHIFVNPITEKNNEISSKQIFFCLKLVFVKRNTEIEVYEEYQKIMLIYQKSDDFLKETRLNFIKFGEKKDIFENKNSETKRNLIEKIQLKYDFILGFDAKNEIWFATVADNDKVTNSLSSLPSSPDNVFLTFQTYNKLEEQYRFESNEDFSEYHKNQGKIVPGINTLDLRMKNTIDELNLHEKFEDDPEYINLVSCWVCLSKFSLLKNNFAGDTIEVGDGSIVKFGMNQISLKILPKVSLA